MVVVPVVVGGREGLGDADLFVVGGPPHFHGMSRTRTCKWAVATAAFDTRFKGPAVPGGRASRPFSRQLRMHRFEIVPSDEVTNADGPRRPPTSKET